MRTRSAVALVTGLMAGLVALVPTDATATAAPAPEPPNHAYLSPDGDGVADTVRIPYPVEKPAGVRILVRSAVNSEVLRRVVRTHQQPGQHHWRWDGRDDAGFVVADGSYLIDIRVKRGTNVDRWGTQALVDTDGDQGTLLTSRPTVYPDATVVDDSVLLTYLRQGWNPTEDAYPGEDYFGARIPLRARLSVVSRRGKVVWEAAHRVGGMSTRFVWAGRRSDGTVVAAGPYDARLLVTDAAGNVTSYVQQVRVSHRQLVAETLTVHLDPATTERTGSISPPGCNGCGEGCSPVDSDRFPGGLSFRDCLGYGYDAQSYARFALPLPFAAAPVDTYRVTATGGPPTAGGTGAGKLSGLTMGPGDATVTTGWGSVDLSHYPYLPEQDLAATWGFTTTQDYDLASFTVEYQHYVEVS
jgi:hypothetical protein